MSDAELDAILTPTAALHSTPNRNAHFQQSARQLRRAHRLRRLTPAYAAIGAFAAGGLGGWFLKSTPAPPASQTIFVPSPIVAAEPPPMSSPVVVAMTPEKHELAAELSDDAPAAAEHYRQAGDLYLQRNNIPAAVRCYRLHLAGADAHLRQTSATDSWLLTSLKSAQPVETKNEIHRGT